MRMINLAMPHGLLIDGVEESLRENSLRTERAEAELKIHRWGDGLWARSAGALALEAMLEPFVSGR